jgi:hypothetical protein
LGAFHEGEHLVELVDGLAVDGSGAGAGVGDGHRWCAQDRDLAVSGEEIEVAALDAVAPGSVVLVYLSTTRGGQPKVIVIACIIGVGVARWFRGDYRSR